MKVGVAISTTGDREDMLAVAEEAWDDAGIDLIHTTYDLDRAGVAATKNRGLAVLMEQGCTHLFLADDDMHPFSQESWERYVQQDVPHLSLSWGGHRIVHHDGTYTRFMWPRGVLLYATRDVVELVGGMRTEYGPGGHEHVEWSRRIHQSGLTPYPYMDLDQRVRNWFYCEDMPRPGERPMQLAARKRRHSTIKRTAADKRRIAELWIEHDWDTSFVEYR
jgi:hypothetical protein